MRMFAIALIVALVVFDLLLFFACFKNEKEIEDEEHRRENQ